MDPVLANESVPYLMPGQCAQEFWHVTTKLNAKPCATFMAVYALKNNTSNPDSNPKAPLRQTCLISTLNSTKLTYCFASGTSFVCLRFGISIMFGSALYDHISSCRLMPASTTFMLKTNISEVGLFGKTSQVLHKFPKTYSKYTYTKSN